MVPRCWSMCGLMTGNDTPSKSTATTNSSMTTARKIYDLPVFEPVLKPVITPIWKCPSPNITLNCSISNGANVTFYWDILSLSENTNRTFEGPELVVNHENEWKQYIFRCIVKNRVSNASSELTITELCNEHNFANRDQSAQQTQRRSYQRGRKESLGRKRFIFKMELLNPHILIPWIHTKESPLTGQLFSCRLPPIENWKKMSEPQLLQNESQLY
ncbi:uncharacterized protein [Mobula birostris]|uniref:uncharacterized protein isoform X1 n=1 Tax=Mobula birostris TaxID=1983395 RepID=UPI003B2877D5